MSEDARERLAAYAHDAWSGWMRYMFSKCYENGNGGLVIPAWAVARWARQMSTEYANLTDAEKKSDLVEADKMLAILRPQVGCLLTPLPDIAEGHEV